MINSKLSKKSLKLNSLKLKNKRTKKSKVSKKNVRNMKGGELFLNTKYNFSNFCNNYYSIQFEELLEKGIQEMQKIKDDGRGGKMIIKVLEELKDKSNLSDLKYIFNNYEKVFKESSHELDEIVRRKELETLKYSH